jgi:2-polyprenyl-3-methyl-5-hydroxy-6-metoxy-1,4-benzoquinol methylase
VIGFLTDRDDAYINKRGDVNEIKLIELYDTGPEAEDYIVTLAFTSLRNRPASLFKLLRTSRSSMNVLEYGSCTSTHGIACAQLGASVHILDISKSMLDFAKKRYDKRGLKVTIHTNKSTLPSNFFDIVICTDVIEHVVNPVEVIKSIWKSMKVGGTSHFHVSSTVNIKKGHLPQAIKGWRMFNESGEIDELFKRVDDYNYIKLKENI